MRISQPEEKITGIIDEIRFHNEENHYVIAKFKRPVDKANSKKELGSEFEFNLNKLFSGNNNTFSAKGVIYSPAYGLTYHLTGKWIHDDRFGDTFVINTYESELPVTEKSISYYLMDNCSGIGFVHAKKLTAKYGADTLHMIKTNIDQVKEEVPGIPVKVLDAAKETLLQHESEESFKIQLNELFNNTSIGKKRINAIVADYGKKTYEIIKSNPYLLIERKGISFLIADKVASNVGITGSDPKRVKAVFVHVLKETGSRGNSCLEKNKVLGMVSELIIDGNMKIIKEELDNLLKEEKSPIIYDERTDTLALTELYKKEVYIAATLKDIAKMDLPPVEVNKEAEEGLFPDQVKALHNCATHPVSILTGSPGTGKTYTIKKLLELFDINEVALAAPTGKAAKRMYEQTGLPASTIHKLLDPKMDDSGKFFFTFNALSKLPYKVIIIDETSMLDINLMYSLISAVDYQTRLIFIGDSNQLPSVGPGNILSDMITSGVIPFVELDVIKRQDPGLIITNCHAIKDGKGVKGSRKLYSDFILSPVQGEMNIKKELFRIITEALPTRFKLWNEPFDPVWDVQVITPYNSITELSCDSLNTMFQNHLNPEPMIERTRYKIGDKVIQTKNDYALGIINGDIGKIVSAEVDTNKNSKSKDIMLTIDFYNPDRQVQISAFENDLKLAYTITCHKFQGSEEKVIVIPAYSGFSSVIMQRNWLYTAVSRAVKLCVIAGEINMLSAVVNRTFSTQRSTYLSEFLKVVKG